ncbi:MAG TPA: MerR family transcriptional regulator [Candidatus Eisenbacteria bacterium]|nr:MerR family transcriptional regulator [Candidatus Eisenbacteria bacterium]
MPTDTPYTIADLARLTDVTPRTVRYYIAQGLLPAPGESGPGAHYGPAHLDRLQLIRRLQRQHLPLAEIRTRLGGLNDSEIAEALRSSEAQPAPDAGSALDYIRTVLGSSASTRARPGPTQAIPAMPSSARPSPTHPSPAPPSPATPSPAIAGPPPPAPTATGLREAAPFALLSRAFTRAAPAVPSDSAPAEAAEPVAAAPPARAIEPPEPTIERSQWERLSLGPNVELHIRRPLSRLEQKRVDRLITIARQVLQEGTP